MTTTETTTNHLLDEVSYVLRHFQPQPVTFVSNNDGDALWRHHEPKQPKGRQISNNKTTSFASFFYQNKSSNVRQRLRQSAQQRHTIQATYIHERIVILRFAIVYTMSTCSDNDKEKEEQPTTRRDTCTIKCIECFPQNCRVKSLADNNKLLSLQALVEEICHDISSSTTTTSLFAVTSRLLQALQQLPKLQHHEPQTATATVILPLNNKARTSMMDLALLLLRAAATSTKSATLCFPVPAAFHNNSGDVWTRQLLHFTNQVDVVHQIMTTTTTPTQQHPAQRLCREFGIFLLSLPWMPSQQQQQQQQSNPPCPVTVTSSGPSTFRLTLDLAASRGSNASPSPHFHDMASKYGTIPKVYHGTGLENAW